jgi:hypothetical protein
MELGIAGSFEPLGFTKADEFRDQLAMRLLASQERLWFVELIS